MMAEKDRQRGLVQDSVTFLPLALCYLGCFPPFLCSLTSLSSLGRVMVHSGQFALPLSQKSIILFLLTA